MAVEFHGTTTSVRLVPSYSTMSRSALTVSAWVNPSALHRYNNLPFYVCDWTINGSASYSRISLYCNSGYVYFRVCPTDDHYLNAILVNTPAAVLTIGTVTHIAGVFYISGSLPITTLNAAIYIDGELSASGTASAQVLTTAATAPNTAAIGNQYEGGSNCFMGTIDDPRLYVRALAADEISTIHASRGHDSIVGGLEHRFKLKEFAPGLVVPLTVGVTHTYLLDSGSLKAVNAYGSENTKISETPYNPDLTTTTTAYSDAIVSSRRRRH